MRRLKPHELHNLFIRYGLKVKTFQIQSSLYHAATGYRVQTDCGEYMLKSHRGPVWRLRAVAAAVRALRHQRFTFMPRWKVTRAGYPFVKHRDQFFYATEWLDGEELGSGRGTLDYRQLGEVLGKLHTVRNPKTSLVGQTTQEVIGQLKLLDTAHRTAIAKFTGDASDEVVQWFLRHGDTCRNLADEAWKAIFAPEISSVLQDEKRRQRFIHGDITRMNIVVMPSGVKLVDWDGVKTGSTFMELVKTLANTGNFTPNYLQAILDGYEQVRPLSKAERKLVAALFRLPREAWMAASRPRLDSSLAQLRFRILSQTWSERLAAIEWMDNWAHQEEGIADASLRRYSRL